MFGRPFTVDENAAAGESHAVDLQPMSSVSNHRISSTVDTWGSAAERNGYIARVRALARHAECYIEERGNGAPPQSRRGLIEQAITFAQGRSPLMNADDP
jgi:hypothetical protein